MGLILESSFFNGVDKISNEGCSSIVYALSDKVAYKRYRQTDYISSKFARRSEKLDLLCEEKIDDVIIPTDKVFRRLEYCDDFYLTGHLLPRVKCGKIRNLKLLLLSFFCSLSDKALHLLEVEAIIKRCHESPNYIVIGDTNGSNFLIDEEGKVKFVDFDNVGIGDFPFDVGSLYTSAAQRIVPSAKGQDIDKVALGFMVMDDLCKPRDQLGIRTFAYAYSVELQDISDHIDMLDVSKASKEVFRALISDTTDRPYVGEVIREISGKEGNFLVKR